MSVFSERLKNLRDKNGLTQFDLARLLGKSRESISKYEKGDREPDLYAITSIAKHFGVSTDYILGLQEDVFEEQEVESQDINNKLITSEELKKYEKYFKDKSFYHLFRLCLLMKENNLDISELDKYINQLIKNKRMQI